MTVEVHTNFTYICYLILYLKVPSPDLIKPVKMFYPCKRSRVIMALSLTKLMKLDFNKKEIKYSKRNYQE